MLPLQGPVKIERSLHSDCTLQFFLLRTQEKLKKYVVFAIIFYTNQFFTRKQFFNAFVNQKSYLQLNAVKNNIENKNCVPIVLKKNSQFTLK